MCMYPVYSYVYFSQIQKFRAETLYLYCMFLQLMADVLDMPVGLFLFPALELVPPKSRVLSRKCYFHYHQTAKWSYQNTALFKQRKKRKLNSFCQMPVVSLLHY
jgi:hypothetical protein